MKKFLLIPVNYNSYEQLSKYIGSCNSAFSRLKTNKDKVSIDIFVADNSNELIDFILPQNNNHFCYKLFKNGNLGYLGGALRILNNLKNVEEYTYVIISNVDIEFDLNFFNSLLKNDYVPSIGWIAPAIISYAENRDKNPKIIKRYNLKALKILRLIYRFPILHYLYNNTLYKRKKFRQSFEAQSIYAGHGSLMIFTGKALSSLLPLSYPVFLFGEECFFAEMLNKNGYSVYYDPSIKVYDKEHVSTGNMKRDFYYKCNHEAINYLISEFYE